MTSRYKNMEIYQDILCRWDAFRWLADFTCLMCFTQKSEHVQFNHEMFKGIQNENQDVDDLFVDQSFEDRRQSAELMRIERPLQYPQIVTSAYKKMEIYQDILSRWDAFRWLADFTFLMFFTQKSKHVQFNQVMFKGMQNVNPEFDEQRLGLQWQSGELMHVDQPLQDPQIVKKSSNGKRQIIILTKSDVITRFQQLQFLNRSLLFDYVKLGALYLNFIDMKYKVTINKDDDDYTSSSKSANLYKRISHVKQCIAYFEMRRVMILSSI